MIYRAWNILLAINKDNALNCLFKKSHILHLIKTFKYNESLMTSIYFSNVFSKNIFENETYLYLRIQITGKAQIQNI